MKILLIEDEALAAEKIIKSLNEINSEIEVLVSLESVEASIEWLNNNPQPDLILSDIHLSDGLCFNIFTAVDISCPIIFTTAYDKYAIKAFEVNSIDYLLKPIQQEALAKALDKFEKIKSDNDGDKKLLFEEFKNLLDQKNKVYKSRFLCKLGNKIKSVTVESVAYFYSEDKVTFLVDQNNNRLPLNNTLDEIEQQLDPKMFFRLNRKYIAHFNAINEIHPYFKGRLKLRLLPETKEDIVVSTEKSPGLKSWLNQ